jgi:preprotein translocase subunit SecA
LRVYTTRDGKWKAVLESIRRARLDDRPVLVGTSSVEASEQLSQLLSDASLPHRVLNARQDAEEAAIVAEAGQAGHLTVATNMAGRGTDIGLGPGVAERGGLHVIATERADARRIDRQLIGRCGRQGDPGSCETILSLEDDQAARYFPRGVHRLLVRVAGAGGVLPHRLGVLLLSLPQMAEERKHGRMRRALMELEEYLESLMAYSGPGI